MGLIPFSRQRVVRRLSTPMLRLSRRDRIYLSDLLESTIVFGSPGSGKTSASGAAFLRMFFSAGMGGLTCAVKPGEAARIIKMAKAAGRGGNLIIVDGSGKHRINFLQYLMSISPDPGQLITNIVDALSTVIAAVNGQIEPGGSDGQFWQKAMKEALLHSVSVLWAAYGRVSLYDVFALLQSRPMTPQQAQDPQWRSASFMAHTLTKAEDAPAHAMHPMDYRAAVDYFTVILANPDSRTTGNILATLSADLAPLMSGAMRELFSSGTGSTFCPEMTFSGQIIILNLPVQVYGQAGLLAQQIIKYLWQKAVLQRKIDRHTRPVFHYCDEYQVLVAPGDADFISRSREAMAATTILTQSIPGLVSKISGSKAEHVANALLACCNTKIFHANGCHITNKYAADIIDKGTIIRYNGGSNVGWSDTVGDGYTSGSSGDGKTTSHSDSITNNRSHTKSGGHSLGWSEQTDYLVQPGVFTRLRKGGRVNRRKVDAIIFQAGKTWHHSGKTFLPVTFRQK